MSCRLFFEQGKDHEIYLKHLYQIYISGKSYNLLRKLIYPYIVPSMLYKFPTKRKI